MIRTSTEIWFNGHSSKEFGIMNVNIDSDSLLEEPFLSERRLNVEKIKYRPESYYGNIEQEEKVFDLKLFFGYNQKMDKELLRKIAKWLHTLDGFKELWFIEDCEQDEQYQYNINKPTRIYFAVVEGVTNLYHNGLSQGYIGVKLKTNSPYCYSSLKTTVEYRLGEGDRVFIYNNGDMSYRPEVSITSLAENQTIELKSNTIEPDNYIDFLNNKKKNNFDFIIKNGKRAKGNFYLNGTVYDGETFRLGNKTYEFDLGDKLPKNKYDIYNILVSVNGGTNARNTLKFEDGIITDGSTVTIGDQTFEYDNNNIYAPSNVQVDISDYCGRAKGILHLNSNLMPNQTMQIDETTYTMVGGTNEFIIKMTDHLLTDGLEQNVIVKNNKINTKQDNVIVTTPKFKKIENCLVRNVTKNPSDLGIRKMKYLDKDFVMVLWDGETNEDYQDLINDVGINDRVFIKFDRVINQETVTSDTIKIRDLEGNRIPAIFDFGSKSDLGKIIGLTPQYSYEYDTDYIIEVTRGLKDKKGINIQRSRKVKIHTRKKNKDTNNYYFKDISPVKVFQFSSPHKFKKQTINTDNIYVLNQEQKKVNIDLIVSNEGKTVNVQPVEKYKQGESYYLHFTTNVLDINDMNVVRNEKIVTFNITTRDNTVDVDIDCDDFYNNIPVDKSFKIPFKKRLNFNQINETHGLIDLRTRTGKQIPLFYSYDDENSNLLEITPDRNLDYNTTYFLYVSKMIQYNDKSSYIDSPSKIRLITEKDPNLKENQDNNSIEDNNDNNQNTVQTTFYDVATNKDFSVYFNGTVSNIKNGIFIKNSKKEDVDFFSKISPYGNGINIYPKPVWELDEKYYVYGTKNITLQRKPRVFAGDSKPDGAGNKGDYENAKEIFEPLGLQVIKTNGWIVKDGKLYDLENEEVKIYRYDIIVGGDFIKDSNKFNEDGTIKDGTIIHNIPLAIFTNGATRIYGVDRVETKKKMLEYSKVVRFSSYRNGTVYTEDTLMFTFSVTHRNNAIEIDVDRNISLTDNRLLLGKNEIPKRIKGMRPKDSIYLYEQSEMDFTVDMNMLIPYKVPIGAKAYASKIGTFHNGIPDDYVNAKKVLEPLGYEIVDTACMTYADKQNIVFKVGDLVIGSELAGTSPADLDSKGNIKSTPPQEDNPNDLRKERTAGIPMGINIYPARRLQGDTSHPNRDGTLKAMEDWAMLLKNVQENKGNLPEGYEGNIALNGITVKYKVPRNAKVYGTGIDIYNAIRYLGDMGYEFVNVGDLKFEEKLALPFKKGDLVVGGVGAKDVVYEGGKRKTVLGVPNIPINGALRLGGTDRYGTERKIKEFAEKLKVQSVNAGDIVKMYIQIDTPENDIINKETELENNIKQIPDNVRIEYHRIKSVKELNRNRLYLEFEENIRTYNYISILKITNLYKLYNIREAEDYLFTAPYQIRIGYTKNETLENIVKAINDTGIGGIDYSLRTFKHKTVASRRLNDDEDEFVALEMGERGNVVTSLIDKVDIKNKFLDNTLKGGMDCNQSNAIIALAKTIEEQNKKPERYNKDKYTCTYNSNSITVTHMLKGSKYNNIICLSNITKLVQTPYLINEKDTLKLQEFLNREKQIAKWENPTLIGGTDPNAQECINALKNTVLIHQGSYLNLNVINKIINDQTISGIEFEYNEIGEEGNILMKTTCVNASLSGKKLKGGLDGLDENEILMINCNKQEIISNLNKDRYKNCNNDWFRIPSGGLTVQVVQGKIKLQLRYREIYLI